MTQDTRLVFLLSKPRSGTTVLAKLLESTGRVANWGEVLNPHDPKNFLQWTLEHAPQLTAAQLGDTVTLFNRYLDERLAATEQPFALLDIKDQQFHLVHPLWYGLYYAGAPLRVASERKALMIHLVRSRILDRLISNEVAERTGVYHLHESEQHREWARKRLAAYVPVRLDPGWCRHLMTKEPEDWLWIARSLKDFALQSITLVYERLLAADGAFSGAVIGALAKLTGLPEGSFDRTPRLKKVISGEPSAMIANYAELEQKLADLDQAAGLRELEKSGVLVN
jgi:LPS sulfotransferase NodH